MGKVEKTYIVLPVAKKHGELYIKSNSDEVKWSLVGDQKYHEKDMRRIIDVISIIGRKENEKIIDYGNWRTYT